MIVYVEIGLEFETREQIDDYCELIENRVSGYLPRRFVPALDKIRTNLLQKRDTVPLAEDWALVPQIIELVNQSMILRPDVWHGEKQQATRVYWEDHFSMWMTDNGQKLGKSLPEAFKWLRKELNIDV